MFIDHLILGPVDVALQEVTEMRVVVSLTIVPAEKTGDLILLRVLSVKYRIFSGGARLVVQVLGANIANGAWNRSSHLRGGIEITDTLELNCLRWLNPQLSDGEVQRDLLLLRKRRVECKLTKSRKETANLISRTIADLSDGLHVY